MTKVVKLGAPEDEPDNLTKAIARTKVREIAVDSSRVQFTSHVLERMEEREITTRHVMTTLRKGSVPDDPLWDANHSDWKVCVVHRAAGAEIEVVAAIDWPDQLVIVTAIKRRT
ncbi:MAG: DUF4258 domain-containing protein [Pseudomonadota bacterium]